MLSDIFSNALRSLGRNPIRTILTIIAVSIGVASVIIISVIGDYGIYAINNELDSLGMGGLTIAPKNEMSVDISLDDVKEARKDLDEYIKEENRCSFYWIPRHVASSN